MTIPARNGAILFDRDGVLNEDIGYLHRAASFRWIDGARDALRLVQERGLLSIVITNQSGVARGLYSERDVDLLHEWMRVELARDGIAITAFYTCPFHPEAVVERYRAADHPNRKPNPGMILKALAEWNIDPHRAVMVGDNLRDIEAASRAGIGSLLFRGGNLFENIGPLVGKLSSGT